MKHTNMALIVLISSGLSLGCYGGNLTRRGNVDLHMGQSQRAAVERMIADPTAGERNTEPVLGLGAPSAKGVTENYHHNEKAEVQERKSRDRTLTQFSQ